jgi:hypothetical protein
MANSSFFAGGRNAAFAVAAQPSAAFGAATTFNPELFNPNVFGVAPGIVPGFGFTPLPFFPTPTPTPGAPASPTATASDLQILIASIPIAQEGHVISSEYHNAIRNALVAIANRLGLGPVSEEITITKAPQFMPLAGQAEWEHLYGIVQKPPGVNAGNVQGWMQLELPDGARIKRMVVFASKDPAAPATPLRIALRRQRMVDTGTNPELIRIEVVGEEGLSRGIEGDVTLPGSGAGAGAIEEFRIVNNREHRYLLTAELINITENPQTVAVIAGIQIVCGR